MKWNIQKRLLVLVMAAGILSFVAMSGLSFYGLSTVRGEMREMGNDLGKAGADLTETLVKYQLKQMLGALATSRADFIDNETHLFREDVKIIANVMTDITCHRL